MNRSTLTLEKLNTFIKRFISRISHNQPAKKMGRPKKYQDDVIITLWLYQTLHGLSYRETLDIAKKQGLSTPSLHDYHYRVKSLDEELLKLLVEECAKVFFSGKEDTVDCYIADATGFSFGDKYNLNWQRGTWVRTVKSHVRLEVVIAVDNKGRRIITGRETGGPYASEIEMLRKILNSIEKLKKVTFIADKGYDAVDHAKGVVQKVFDMGFVPAVNVKGELE